jgi:hypothetical protein
MKFPRLAATTGALVIGLAAIGVAAPASADVKSFVNTVVTPQENDPDIRSVTFEHTPKSLVMTMVAANLAVDPTTLHFFLMQTDIVANAGDVREFSVRRPEEPNGPWSLGGYYRVNGAFLPSDFAGTFAKRTSGANTTFVLTITDPVALPWSGPTWIAATYRADDNTYKSAGVIRDGELHGFGPVNDLSIPVATSLTTSTASQTLRRTSATLTGTVRPAASGTVEFFDGSSVIGSTTVSGSNPDFSFAVPNSLAIGSHALHAVFTPETPRFAISTSPPVALRVVATPAPKATKVSIKLSRSKQHYKGKRVKATIRVAGKHAGKVRIYDGKHKLKTLTLRRGTATYTFSSKLSKKKHVIKAVYLPKHPQSFAKSTSKKVVLRVVK